MKKHVLRQDLNIEIESVTECAEEIPASRRSSTLTSDPHYSECIPGGVKPLTAQSTRAWEDCTAHTTPAECVAWCVSLPGPVTTGECAEPGRGLLKSNAVHLLSPQMIVVFVFLNLCRS